MAPGRVAVGAGVHRSVPPLRRGAAVAAVTGGAFALMGSAAPLPAPDAPVPPVGPITQVADALQMRTAVEPVAPAPEQINAADLVKAVQLAEAEVARLAAEEAEKAAAEAKAAAEKKAAAKLAEAAAATAASGSVGCGLDTSGLGAVKSHVEDAAEFLGCLFGQPSMHGVAGRAGTSDHPSGKALDFMVDRATGDALAACALRNKSALGITYVIWEQRINFGDGWEPMEDRGGATANHMDHVHISFASSGGGGSPRAC